MKSQQRWFMVVAALTTGLAGWGCSDPKVSGAGTGGPGGAGNPGGNGAAGAAGGGPIITLPDAAPLPPDAAVGDGGLVSYPGGITRPCTNLECRQTTCLLGDCKQPTCSGSARTTLTGRIFDPAGKIPLYNVVVYVPNTALDPIPTGATCDRCESATSGKPITATLTNTKGEFVLDNVPAGAGVPLVIQIGKWRRQIALPEMRACTENRLDDPSLMRLPRSQKEGNIPRIALTTGGLDRLECLLRKMGIDESEFTPPTGTGRVNFYAGKAGNFLAQATSAYAPTLNGGAAFPPAIPFWSDPAALKKYDMVVLSCEGNWYLADKPEAARQAMVEYANLGGRIFASHWHGAWIQFGPAPWNQVASFVPPSQFMTMNQLPDLPAGFTTDIDSSFPKGEALADWLVNVQASTVRGKLALMEGKHSVFSVDATKAQRWIHSSAIPLDFENTNANGVQYLTFNTPVGAAAAQSCGRTVFTDIHVSAGDMAGPPYPQGCVTTDLSPQEKALVFMLFDLSSCIQPDTDRPKPPVID